MQNFPVLKKRPKPRNLLIVTQNFTVGGLETQIKGQVEELKSLGWKVHLVCGSEYDNAYIPAGIDSVNQTPSIDNAANTQDLLRSVVFISDLIKKHQINIVHAHPFTSVLPSFLASRDNNVPFYLTLHGPASLGPGRGGYNGYGENFYNINELIFKSSNMIVVSEELSDRIKNISKQRPIILPNSVKVNKIRSWHHPKKHISDSRWLVVSRLDGEKNKGIKEFIKAALQAGVGHIDIAGKGPEEDSLRSWCASSSYDQHVGFLGPVQNPQSIMREYDGCAGMGRVVLESIERRKITCLVGYDGVKGILGGTDIKQAAYSNFSGRGLPNVAIEDFAACFAEAAKGNVVTANRSAVRRSYSQKETWRHYADAVGRVEAHHKGGTGVLKNLTDAIEGLDIDNSKPWYTESTTTSLLKELLA